jgi:RNA polymerase sigma-70 factor (ECF subfamily)
VFSSADTSELKQIRSRKDFEQIFRSYYSNLCSYAFQYLNDLASAEEVVQEVMYRLWMNRDQLQIETTMKGYLFRSVRNHCLNLGKHAEVHQRFRVMAESGAPDIMRSGEDLMILTELQNRISEAIGNLPLERRKIFILSRYEGLTYPQIAEKLGISIKTVENQMSSALKKLREELSEYLPWLLLFFTDIFSS